MEPARGDRSSPRAGDESWPHGDDRRLRPSPSERAAASTNILGPTMGIPAPSRADGRSRPKRMARTASGMRPSLSIGSPFEDPPSSSTRVRAPVFDSPTTPESERVCDSRRANRASQRLGAAFKQAFRAAPELARVGWRSASPGRRLKAPGQKTISVHSTTGMGRTPRATPRPHLDQSMPL